jgi:transcriptional regulator with XRE-family HTH domain
MSVTSKIRLVRKLLSSKEYRDAYVEERIKTGLPFQLRAMRAARNWSQAFLGEMAGMRQNAISRLEDEEYGNLSINTLIRVANAFDTGLLVKFVPFSRLVKEYEDVSPARLESRSITIEEEISDLSKWAKDEPTEASLGNTSFANKATDLSEYVSARGKLAPDIANTAGPAHTSAMPEPPQRPSSAEIRKGYKSRRRQSKTEPQQQVKKSQRRQTASETISYVTSPGNATSAYPLGLAS